MYAHRATNPIRTGHPPFAPPFVDFKLQAQCSRFCLDLPVSLVVDQAFLNSAFKPTQCFPCAVPPSMLRGVASDLQPEPGNFMPLRKPTSRSVMPFQMWN